VPRSVGAPSPVCVLGELGRGRIVDGERDDLGSLLFHLFHLGPLPFAMYSATHASRVGARDADRRVHDGGRLHVAPVRT
jgi:hypothetical protein